MKIDTTKNSGKKMHDFQSVASDIMCRGIETVSMKVRFNKQSINKRNEWNVLFNIKI